MVSRTGPVLLESRAKARLSSIRVVLRPPVLKGRVEPLCLALAPSLFSADTSVTTVPVVDKTTSFKSRREDARAVKIAVQRQPCPLEIKLDELKCLAVLLPTLTSQKDLQMSSPLPPPPTRNTPPAYSSSSSSAEPSQGGWKERAKGWGKVAVDKSVVISDWAGHKMNGIADKVGPLLHLLVKVWSRSSSRGGRKRGREEGGEGGNRS